MSPCDITAEDGSVSVDDHSIQLDNNKARKEKVKQDSWHAEAKTDMQEKSSIKYDVIIYNTKMLFSRVCGFRMQERTFIDTSRSL